MYCTISLISSIYTIALLQGALAGGVEAVGLAGETAWWHGRAGRHELHLAGAPAPCSLDQGPEALAFWQTLASDAANAEPLRFAQQARREELRRGLAAERARQAQEAEAGAMVEV